MLYTLNTLSCRYCNMSNVITVRVEDHLKDKL